MAKREFLMLAHTFKKQSIGGWLMSEKLDGMRAFWDGGISRGISCSEVSWANTQKDYIKKTPPVATGLWSRGAKAIYAPNWFLNYLPDHPVDGELYAGRSQFQYVMSVVKGDQPDDRWRDIRFCCFGFPAYSSVFAPGVIDKTGCELKEDYSDSQLLLMRAIDHDEDNDYFYWHPQIKLPMAQDAAIECMNTEMDCVMKAGGEGLMLANPHRGWEPCRSHNLLKVKRFQDETGVVIDYIWGKHTDKGSKLKGLMGAIIVEFQEQCFELSGFTDEERHLDYIHPYMNDNELAFASQEETDGGYVLDHIHNVRFPRGSKIRFKYRELTDRGIPKEARYFR